MNVHPVVCGVKLNVRVMKTAAWSPVLVLCVGENRTGSPVAIMGLFTFDTFGRGQTVPRWLAFLWPVFWAELYPGWTISGTRRKCLQAGRCHVLSLRPTCGDPCLPLKRAHVAICETLCRRPERKVFLKLSLLQWLLHESLEFLSRAPVSTLRHLYLTFFHRVSAVF